LQEPDPVLFTCSILNCLYCHIFLHYLVRACFRVWPHPSVHGAKCSATEDLMNSVNSSIMTCESFFSWGPWPTNSLAPKKTLIFGLIEYAFPRLLEELVHVLARNLSKGKAK
jgi:hypothetical protein